MEQTSMTRVVRTLVGAGLAAVLGAVLFGFSGVFSAHEASAESPPNPPSRFAGTVLVDGAKPAAGTVIQARIGNTSCGTTTVTGDGNYVVDVPALDPGATPNCGTDGATVSFWIGDKLAQQTGSWANYKLSVLNLTYTTPPTPTATATGTGTATGTPKAPVTGSGTGTSDDAGLWLWVVLGAGAVALGTSGIAVSRRSR
jgi:hypothetical protein